jgi:hypothetical protein
LEEEKRVEDSTTEIEDLGKVCRLSKYLKMTAELELNCAQWNFAGVQIFERIFLRLQEYLYYDVATLKCVRALWSSSNQSANLFTDMNVRTLVICQCHVPNTNNEIKDIVELYL